MNIFKHEREIELLVHHNMQKYNYVGEKGREYEVIQSVFYEINHLTELSNRQIRWYTVIINLIMSFYNQRRRGDLPGSLIIETPGGFKAGTKIRESESAGEIYFPPFIDNLDPLIVEIARMGVLISAKKSTSPSYLDHKLERIDALLAKLLQSMDALGKDTPLDDVFILAVKNAAENVIYLCNHCPEIKKKNLPGFAHSGIYKRLITGRIGRVPKKKIAALHNMEAFWNGFITDNFSPLMIG